MIPIPTLPWTNNPSSEAVFTPAYDDPITAPPPISSLFTGLLFQIQTLHSIIKPLVGANID